jgi:ribosome-associated protein
MVGDGTVGSDDLNAEIRQNTTKNRDAFLGSMEAVGIMEEIISRSAKKRRAKGVENLVLELFQLSAKHIATLPCDATVKDEIVAGQGLRGGARKRQVKYLAKVLRQEAELAQELLTFLESRKGSKLKEAGEFHELERLRDAIINDAIVMHDEQTAAGRVRQTQPRPGNGVAGQAIEEALRILPGLNPDELQKTALMYARTRKPLYNRELFRLLKSALERGKFTPESVTARDDEKD